ncbi:two-component system response regulator [Planctomycetota bacterium]
MNESQAPSKGKIVIIDGDCDFLKLLSEKLTMASFEVLVSDEPSKGIMKAANNSVDLILMDLDLPKVDGLVVLEKILQHEATCDIPVIIVTARHHRVDIRKAANLGAFGFVRKPVKIPNLLKKIKQALNPPTRKSTGLTMP